MHTHVSAGMNIAKGCLCLGKPPSQFLWQPFLKKSHNSMMSIYAVAKTALALVAGDQ